MRCLSFRLHVFLPRALKSQVLLSNRSVKFPERLTVLSNKYKVYLETRTFMSLQKERQAPSEDELQKKLSSFEYHVLREGGTERAFTGEYWDCHKKGVYECRACGQPLFRSETKYDSGSGWPSFFAPIDEDAVKTRVDSSHGMVRTEALCSVCNSHLGHVFPDGPTPTGLRYCMNSVCLKLKEE
ncbi:peptide-methionine (R)-S-oxide reductase [Galdieria sulphuraria]|uniref:Peptide-methionine (R)-S-oxide reductase n=1 Tax=Galdieria sulphuraria TaxID=130081 RepID=M2VWC6_GALSU|nr:peptide-methionine (R)-S-oxide reductase [Galdieria sulphuraria]EME27546.1 peptide-methionine (R)-S-oxide reductase [Galdieria sulphuraria]|eukprot:XP_005704066.1 peptide-methionine (R)-S-oxide reductase [Galdieria sulphuraria]